MTTAQSFVIILGVSTVITLYGMLKKKDWFWKPEDNLNSPFAWQELWNFPFRYFFGKWGVVVFNIVTLVILWGIVLYFVFQGKCAMASLLPPS